MEQPQSTSEIERMLDELRTTNSLLREQIRISRDWRIPLRNGLASGLGTVIGATVLVAILLAVLKPFEGIAPGLERLATELQQGNRR
ncbi:MAG: hypothetical protein HONBIEJF_01486 [Fimbriimonadaceae bacterium]|nr:hypothetical protein [Fimbriimonadaceae bacterium]